MKKISFSKSSGIYDSRSSELKILLSSYDGLKEQFVGYGQNCVGFFLRTDIINRV